MPIDPLKLFDSESIAAAALYAKRVASDTADLYPLLINPDGSLLVTITAGTISVSTSTKVTIDNTPIVSLASTKVTVEATTAIPISGSVSLSSTKVTVDNTVPISGSVSLSSTKVTVEAATALPISGSVSLTSTIVTVAPQAGSSLATTGCTITNAVGNPANVSLTSTNVTVNIGRPLTGTTVSISATTGTVAAAGTNRLKVYAVSVTTTATTSSVITFVNGTYGGQVLWRAVLQAPSGANSGLNLAVTPPAYLFATGSAQLLRLNLGTSIPVEVSVSYFDEA